MAVLLMKVKLMIEAPMVGVLLATDRRIY